MEPADELVGVPGSFFQRLTRRETAPSAFGEPRKSNEQLVGDATEVVENDIVRESAEFTEFINAYMSLEYGSPIFKLNKHRHGPSCGFYHDDVRQDKVMFSELQRVSDRALLFGFSALVKSTGPLRTRCTQLWTGWVPSTLAASRGVRSPSPQVLFKVLSTTAS